MLGQHPQMYGLPETQLFATESLAARYHGRSDIFPLVARHRNICEFLHAVPASHTLRVRGEDIVSDPARGLREMLAWLGLRMDDEAIEEMKHPERSPYACYGPPSAYFGNDRAFLQDPVLRPARAEKHSLEGPLSWCDDGREFSAEVRELAQKFGYE